MNSHSYLTNFYLTNKYFLYYKELVKEDNRKVIEGYPILADAKQTFYFRAILHLYNFLKRKEDLYLGNIIEIQGNQAAKNELESGIKNLENDTYLKNILF